jgi:hypothetical protein
MTASMSQTNDEVSLPPAFALAGVVALTLALGNLNFATGYELSFFVFYFFPVALAAWVAGTGAGWAVAVFCGAVRGIADWLCGHTCSSSFYAVWNAAMRFASPLVGPQA